jgi:hypothetical protein
MTCVEKHFQSLILLGIIPGDTNLQDCAKGLVSEACGGNPIKFYVEL